MEGNRQGYGTVNSVLEDIIDGVVKKAAEKLYEAQKAKAIRELEVAFECAKVDILAACAVEIRSRLDDCSTDTEIRIRIKR